MFAVSTLAFGLSSKYLASASSLGQILGTSAKYQGRYCKHQVILSLHETGGVVGKGVGSTFPVVQQQGHWNSLGLGL